MNHPQQGPPPAGYGYPHPPPNGGYQFPQYPGYPGYAPGQAGPPRRRGARPSVILAVLAGVATLVFGTAAVLYASTLEPSRVLDNQAVEEGVQRILTEEYSFRVRSVSCPSGQPVEPRSRFDCTATMKVGEQRRVPVVIVDDTGRYRVRSPELE
ncbi:DUF4333 domain-containing protein [Actinopolyspora mortivallis]|uniref:DUF4333 domain-containing protein n=1 Tax=Actinopolyspora mortivallis TaxID=33906 RepID=A0A2T0GWJ0_ACTMO|nr:DUF4333 domain-containing protein [Actinopolyspora mortivallis]PRW63457.1 hypothetical protein CEP50_10265 [Actinopolyspora mortivallis]